MVRRLIRNEDGMTMGVTVITVALIAVMGAGILTFVMTDLNSVVEVNQGQKAFEMADSGVQIARRQIGTDARESSYLEGGPRGDWAPTSYETTSGKTLTIDGNTVNVSIKPFLSDSDTPTFRVVSEGAVGEAKRKIEALIASPQWGVKAYYTPGDIYIDKDTQTSEPNSYKLIDRIDIRGVSLFAGGDVILADNWGVGAGTPGNNVWGYGNDDDSYMTDYLNESATPIGSRSPSHWENRGSRDNTSVPFAQPHIRIVGNASCPELVNRWQSEGAFDSATSPGYQTDVLGDWYKPPYNTVHRPLDNSRYCEDGLENYAGGLYAGDDDIRPDPYPDVSKGTKYKKYQTANIAAEGLICRATDYDADNVCDTSIANIQPGDALGGSAFRLGYDSSTLNHPTISGFYEKPTPEAPRPLDRRNDLTYPFDTKPPNANDLKLLAESQSRVGGGTRYVDLDVEMNYLGTGNNDVSKWRNLYPNGNTLAETIVFIDAGGRSIELPRDNSLNINADKTFPRQGILVVRCGNLTNAEEFQGLIIVLSEAGPGDSPTMCADKGNYRAGKPGIPINVDPSDYGGEIDVNGYVYAQGTGDPSPVDVNPADGNPDYEFGIFVADGANIDRLDPEHRGLPAIVGGGGASGAIESWRECYSAVLNTC